MNLDGSGYALTLLLVGKTPFSTEHLKTFLKLFSRQKFRNLLKMNFWWQSHHRPDCHSCHGLWIGCYRQREKPSREEIYGRGWIPCNLFSFSLNVKVIQSCSGGNQQKFAFSGAVWWARCFDRADLPKFGREPLRFLALLLVPVPSAEEPPRSNIALILVNNGHLYPSSYHIVSHGYYLLPIVAPCSMSW